MLEALLLGALAQLSLLLSGLLASGVTVPRRIIGWLAGFGAGALVSAITFDLTEQAEALGNIPQALAPSAELSASGWSRQRLSALWATVVVACGLAAGLGYLAGSISGDTGDRMAALAAGGLLAMLTNSLMPFAFDRGGRLAGMFTVLGFALAVLPR